MDAKCQENLLTKDEITFVIDDARSIWDEGKSDIFWLSKGKTAIHKVSSKTDLILVYGNNDTGYEHILNRHFFFHKPFRKDNRSDTPSQFPDRIAPINLIFLAEQIYKDINKKAITENELFDVYEAKFGNAYVKESNYRLLTYTGTGIIHTLYVCDNKKPFNIKTLKNFDYYKTAIRYTYNTETCEHTLNQGYINIDKQKVFELTFYFNLYKQYKKLSITVFNDKMEVVAEKELKTEPFTLNVGSQYFLTLSHKLDLFDTRENERLAKDFLRSLHK